MGALVRIEEMRLSGIVLVILSLGCLSALDESIEAGHDFNEVTKIPQTEVAEKQVLKKALCHDGLARGIRECAKMLDKQQVHLCLLADNCNEPAYKKLIEALCTEHGIPLMHVEDNSQLGEWAGLCKMDAEGNARKVVSCSCVCITDYGEQSEALNFLLKEVGN